jgi:hypothetical protein
MGTGGRTAADEIIHDLSKELPNYTKNTIHWFENLKTKFQIAIDNAKKLTLSNIQTKSTNPETNMHELIAYLMDLKNQMGRP